MSELLRDSRVAVIAGGFPYEQDSVSKSAMHVLEALSDLHYPAECFRDPFNAENFCGFNPVTSVIVDPFFANPDGTGFVDIRDTLESLGRRYTGSDPRAAAICRDKVLSKTYFAAVGVPTPRHFVIQKDTDSAEIREAFGGFSPPVILKPVFEGSGVGVHLCSDYETLTSFVSAERSRFGSLLLEEYVRGIDTTVTVIGHGSKTSALVPVEIELRTSPIYDYETKRGDAEKQHIPARHDQSVLDRLRLISVATHRAIGCRGLSRIDYRVCGPEIWCLEVNASPALGKHGNLPRAWRFERGTYESLIEHLLRDSLED